MVFLFPCIDDRWRPRRRHDVLRWAVAAVLGLTVHGVAHAGALYKCVNGEGQIAYTNKPAGLIDCVKLSSFVDPPPLKAQAKSAGSDTTKVSNPNYRSGPGAALPETLLAPIHASTSPAAAANAASTTALAPEAVVNPWLKPAAAAATAPTDYKVQRGSVYKVSRANGIVEYTNVKPRDHSPIEVLFTYIATCSACDVHSPIDWSHTALNLLAYHDEVVTAALQFGVPEALLRAVIHAESAFNPNALSSKGAQGLMQLMPDTAIDLGVVNPWDAAQNIRGGAQYLAQLLKRFNGDERLAAAAYNSGEANVRKYAGVPPFDETQVYVERVGTLRQRYAGMPVAAN
jgi:soluble lytic murein transglycosylase-like protein